MADTFHTRIPTLSDSELEEYLRNHSRYELEAVEIAAAELKKRGHDLSRAQIDAISASIQERDIAEGRLTFGQERAADVDHSRTGRRKIRQIAGIMLALGLGVALTIYFTAGPPSADPLGYDPMDTKKYLRELEVYGGKANVFSVEIQEWFSGLWHGRTLAATIAVLTVLLTSVFWFISRAVISSNADRARAGTTSKATC
jgi:hypothetical protein